MFHTDETNRHPLSRFFGAKISTWEAVEVAIETPWLVAVERVTEQSEELEDEPDLPAIRRTVLLSSLEILEQMLQSQKSRNSTLESVWVMTPGWLNESGEWKMSRCAKLLIGQFDISRRGDFVDHRLIQTSDGSMVSFGINIVDPCDVRNIRQLFELPAQPSSLK